MDDTALPPEVRAEFIRELFIRKAYQERLALRGFGVSYLRIHGFLDLEGLVIPTSVIFDNVRFDNYVYLSDAHITGSVGFFRSEVPLLALTHARISDGVRIEGAETVATDGAHVEGDVEINSVDELSMAGVQIDGNLKLSRISFRHQLNLRDARVKGSVTVLDSGDPDADLHYVGGQNYVTVIDTRTPDLDLSDARIEKDLVIQASGIGVLAFSNAEIKGSFRAQGSLFQKIDASNARISEEFALEPTGPRVTKWLEPSALNLSNARISQLSSSRSLGAWPASIDVHNTHFDSFVSRASDPKQNGGAQVQDERVFCGLAQARNKRRL
jgi:cytoskeletal protein CcmA (bactofilin family)